MSIASERKGMVQAVAGYSLMGVPQLAALLDCDADTARQIIDDGQIPSVLVGKRQKVDPVDVAVYILASKQGITPAEYWARFSESDVLESARRFYRHAKKVAAA